MILFVPADLESILSLHFFSLISYTSEESLAPSFVLLSHFEMDLLKLFEPTSWTLAEEGEEAA